MPCASSTLLSCTELCCAALACAVLCCTVQTRFHLPVWLGFGAAFRSAIEKDPENLNTLRTMYAEWPFFRVTLDLLEMVFLKGDPRVAELYERVLCPPELYGFGKELRDKYFEARSLLLQVKWA